MSETTNGLQVFENNRFGKVRVVMKDGEPWFVARDVCKILGTEAEDVSKILDVDEFSPLMDTIRTLNDSNGLRKDSRIISESGLYSLVLRSRKPEAKEFKRWVTHDILPAISSNGGYRCVRTKPRKSSSPAPYSLHSKLLREWMLKRRHSQPRWKTLKVKLFSYRNMARCTSHPNGMCEDTICPEAVIETWREEIGDDVVLFCVPVNEKNNGRKYYAVFSPLVRPSTWFYFSVGNIS